MWSTDREPDGILRKACGNRREAVCPSCAERYRGDAYQLIAAGLRGGKGVPESIVEHPAVFVTLTAPSFGLVHTRPLGSDGERAAVGRAVTTPVCEHGVALSCGRFMTRTTPCLGEPMCADCFDHRGAVIWNNQLGELWRRTGASTSRACSRATLGMTQKRVARAARVAYVKVAEYQRRGLVHLHVVARLDRAMPDYRADELRPPDRRFGAELLETAVRETVAAVSAPIPDEAGGGRVRWGPQLEVRAARPPGAARGRRATSPSTRPRAPSWPAASYIASPSTSSASSRCASTSAPTCARPSRSTPTPSSPSGDSAPARTRSAIAGTA